MELSKKAIELIKQFEGCSFLEYTCVAGKRTIGYGHVIGINEHYPAGVTETMAEEILKNDLQIASKAVSKYVTSDLNQNQFGALVSFVFNVGAGNFSRSMLLKALNVADFNESAQQLMRWVYVNGFVCKGLIRRRKAEVALFCLKYRKS